jgi:hypothetical protein
MKEAKNNGVFFKVVVEKAMNNKVFFLCKIMKHIFEVSVKGDGSIPVG